MNMTEIEAVNIILQQIGEDPVNTIDNEYYSESNIAYKNLINVSKEVQSKGWFFNTELSKTLPIDTNSKIKSPINTLRIQTNDTTKITIRGGYVYDITNKTYTFDVSPNFDIVYMLDFEELPFEAQNYIALKTARKVSSNLIGSQTIYNLNREDENTALLQLEELELTSQKHNIFDNAELSKMLSR